MKLESKGPIQPPPVLPGAAQTTSLAVQGWPGIISATHWDLYNLTRVDGADFYAGEQELGHIHTDGSVHIPTGTALGKALIAGGFAKNFPYGGRYGEWVRSRIGTAADAEVATWMFRLNYDRLHGRALPELLASIGERELQAH
ncbi:MAG: hypothetical protein JWQ72_3412 [Polaromonas sp.]|nr:hypothetical protein [Polaromonas sp.]